MKKNPSKHRIEEHDMLNWLKANRKKMNAGELKEERVELFQSDLAVSLLCFLVADEDKGTLQSLKNKAGGASE